jgi:hypothetical protein
MTYPLFDYSIPVNQLPSCEADLFKLLKINSDATNLDSQDMVRSLITQASDNVDIRSGYRSFNSDSVEFAENKIICDKVVFECDTTVARQLEGSSSLIIFAATLGPDFDKWCRCFFDSGDPFSGYVADLIGSIRIEQAVEWLNDIVEESLHARDLRCTNRFSPGYCGWDVYEQHKLFSLLPQKFLGINLHSSALMTPIKSISGVIGAGKDVQKSSYTCAFCAQENCFMRRGKSGELINR